MLDLTIEINDDGQIKHTTYQKQLNLYAYVPRTSAHPPGMLCGLVIIQLARYWKQNTSTDNYEQYATLLYQRLRSQGYDSAKLDSEFMEAENKIDRTRPCVPSTKTKNLASTAFFHLTYHPHGLQNRHLHQSLVVTAILVLVWEVKASPIPTIQIHLTHNILERTD